MVDDGRSEQDARERQQKAEQPNERDDEQGSPCGSLVLKGTDNRAVPAKERCLQ